MMRLQTLSIFVLVALVSAGCSATTHTLEIESSPDPAVVAEYAGQTLTLEQFEEQYVRASNSRTVAAEDSLAAYEDFLVRYVDFRLKVAEARRIGLDEDPEIQEEIATYRDQLAQPYLLEREVMEGIVRNLYERQQEEISAAHLLITVAQDAAPEDTLAAFQRIEAIRDSVIAGDLGFTEAVMRHSEDPSKAQNQGQLGYFTGGRMIVEFEDMAYQTPVDSLSPVFRTAFGYHMLHVDDRRPSTGEIRASHILIRLAPDATAEDSTRAYQRAEEILREIRGGANFAALAGEHSEDSGSAVRGGDLGFFTHDRMVTEFSEAAFALEQPGQLSDIVRSQFGLHLIQLTERRENPSYEEAYDQLKALAERLPRTQQRRLEVGRTYRADLGSSFDDAVIRTAVADISDQEVIMTVARQGFGEHQDSVFASIGDTPFTLGEMVEDLQRSRVNPQVDQTTQLIDLFDQFLDERAITIAARQLEDRNPEFRRLMDEYADGVLLFRLSEDSIWTAAARDSLGLLAHYEANAERFQFPERLRLHTLHSRSDSLMNLAAGLLDEGLPPAEVVMRFRGDDEARPEMRLDTMFIASRGVAFFDRAFELEEGEYAEPERYRGEWVILYLDGTEAPRQMTFDEARAQVTTEYQGVVEREFVDRLRREANVRLYPERLTAAFESERLTSLPSQ